MRQAVASWDETCNTLYFPHGRKKLGGVFCRLEPGHDGDHWCEAEDEMDEARVEFGTSTPFQHSRGESVGVQDVPHGECVDCGATT